MHSSVSVVIANMPWVDSEHPTMAPAVLKSSLKAINVDAKTLDLNALIRKQILDHPKFPALVKFLTTEQIEKDVRAEVSDLIDNMCDRLLECRPDWILLSLLTYLSQISTRWLCFRIRQKNPNIKIVIGGPGAFVSLKSLDCYAEDLKAQGLIDFYVRGDGESAVQRLFKNEIEFPGINQTTWVQLPTLNDQPYPDFDDYDWSLYNRKRIMITGSRGCVRKCTFCDIHEHWSKFQWRTGQDIFNEMRYQHERHGINFFSFSDSLVNGNQKEFGNMLSLLADYNSGQDSDQTIKWTGSFICRPKNQMKEPVWRLLAESGAAMLFIGVESFVEHIRYHIGKKFSNHDLEYALEMCAKYNIPVSILLIVGYVTETAEDFAQQLAWIQNNRKFANHPVISVNIGSGLAILPDTWLDRNYKVMNIQLRDNNVRQDWTRDEIQSTPEIRMQWHQKIQQCLRSNGFRAYYMQDNHVLIEQHINAKYQQET